MTELNKEVAEQKEAKDKVYTYSREIAYRNLLETIHNSYFPLTSKKTLTFYHQEFGIIPKCYHALENGVTYTATHEELNKFLQDIFLVTKKSYDDHDIALKKMLINYLNKLGDLHVKGQIQLFLAHAIVGGIFNTQTDVSTQQSFDDSKAEKSFSRVQLSGELAREAEKVNNELISTAVKLIAAANKKNEQEHVQKQVFRAMVSRFD